MNSSAIVPCHLDLEDPEWHNRRRKGIGGSEWAHVLGLKPWGCARQLFYKKTGVAPDYPEPYSGFMKRGHRMEELVAQEARDLTKRKITKPGRLARHDGLPFWWIGNIDRKMWPMSNERRPTVVEIKTMSEWPFRKMIQRFGDELPLAEVIGEGYYLQCQHYMALTGWPRCLFFALEPSGWKSFYVTIEIDPDLIESMEWAGQAFWKRVVEGHIPQRLEASDSRCQKCAWRLECHGDEFWDAEPEAQAGELVFLQDPVLLDKAERFYELKEIIKSAEEQAGGYRDEIIAHLDGKPAKIQVGEVLVHLYNVGKTKVFDMAGFKAKHLKMWERFKTKTKNGYQVLQVKGVKRG